MTMLDTFLKRNGRNQGVNIRLNFYEMKHEEQYYQMQIGKTAAFVLGLDYYNVKPVVQSIESRFLIPSQVRWSDWSMMPNSTTVSKKK